ncbi:tyrosine-type recombinase/integrase [Francisella noatunensis subsp. noatunensis]|nr:tyrosine-type recombinase/integrase [Francisella noatunensis subsp. noatunensis]
MLFLLNEGRISLHYVRISLNHSLDRLLLHDEAERVEYIELGFITPHILRHTFCKNLVNAGVGLEQIAVLADMRRLKPLNYIVIHQRMTWLNLLNLLGS